MHVQIKRMNRQNVCHFPLMCVVSMKYLYMSQYLYMVYNICPILSCLFSGQVEINRFIWAGIFCYLPALAICASPSQIQPVHEQVCTDQVQ